MSLIDRQGDNSLEIIEDQPSPPPKNTFAKVKIAFVALIVLLIAGRFLYSFYLSTSTLLVDNPTSEAITFQIWDMPEQTLQPFESKTIDLKTGTYDLKIDGQVVSTFQKKSTHTQAFLNPTNEMYLKEYMVYGSEAWYNSLPENKVDLYYNDQIEWPFQSYTWYYISGDWDYGFLQEFPEEVTLWKYQSYTIKTKLYRYDDFVDMYNQYYTYEEDTQETTWTWEVIPE